MRPAGMLVSVFVRSSKWPRLRDKARRCIYTYICMYINTYIHVCMYMYSHTHFVCIHMYMGLKSPFGSVSQVSYTRVCAKRYVCISHTHVYKTTCRMYVCADSHDTRKHGWGLKCFQPFKKCSNEKIMLSCVKEHKGMCAQIHRRTS
jgi:hypothetical protein